MEALCRSWRLETELLPSRHRVGWCETYARLFASDVTIGHAEVSQDGAIRSAVVLDTMTVTEENAEEILRANGLM